MRTTIDAAGRVVIPKRMREAAGLVTPSEIEIEVQNGRVEIEPVQRKIRLERVGYFLVAHVEGADGEPFEFDLDVHREEMERERFGI